MKLTVDEVQAALPKHKVPKRPDLLRKLGWSEERIERYMKKPHHYALGNLPYLTEAQILAGVRTEAIRVYFENGIIYTNMVEGTQLEIWLASLSPDTKSDYADEKTFEWQVWNEFIGRK